MKHLSTEGGLGVLEQHLKVGLVPGTSLRSRLESIIVTTERIVSVGSGIASTVRLSTGLDPDESIDEGVTGASRGSDTEPGSVDIAPVTPGGAETLDGITSGIDDGVGGHATLLEERGEGVNVALLILALVVLGISGTGELSWAGGECVPAGDVGGDTEDLLGGTSGLVDLGNSVGSGF